MSNCPQVGGDAPGGAGLKPGDARGGAPMGGRDARVTPGGTPSQLALHERGNPVGASR